MDAAIQRDEALIVAGNPRRRSKPERQPRRGSIVDEDGDARGGRAFGCSAFAANNTALSAFVRQIDDGAGDFVGSFRA